MTQAQNLANLSQDYGVIPMSNRNFIVDGAVEYVQGGSSALSGNALGYTANVMWMGNAGTGGAATINNQSARSNGLGGESGANGLYAHSQTTASTGALATQDLPSIVQRVEFVNKPAGKSVTLSMKLMCSAGTMTIPAAKCTQNFGTGGSPSPTLNLDKAVNWVVGTTQKKFSVRLDLPTVQALTLGTNNNDFTAFGIYLPAGWTGTLYMTEMQVEISRPISSSDINGAGGEPTTFEYRGWQTELARIERYFTSISNMAFYRYAPSAIGYSYNTMQLPVPMRQQPAMSVPVITYTNCSAVNFAADNANTYRLAATCTAAGEMALTGVQVVMDARL